MTPEEHSSSAGRPDLDLDEQRDEGKDEGKDEGAPVDGGLARLDAPTSPVYEGAD